MVVRGAAHRSKFVLAFWPKHHIFYYLLSIIFYLALSSQNATAPAAATLSESTPCCMGIMTV